MNTHHDETEDHEIRQLLADSLAPNPLDSDEIERLAAHADGAFDEDQLSRILDRTRMLIAHSPVQIHRRGTERVSDRNQEITMKPIDPVRYQRRRHNPRGAVAALAVSSLALAMVLFWTSQESFRRQAERAQTERNKERQIARIQGAWMTAESLSPAVPNTVAVGDVVQTGPRERRRLGLPDGSVLYVNESTTFTVADDRRVQVDSGELFVEVAPRSGDSSGTSSFEVVTPTRTITALGTQFGVNVDSSDSDVLVTQGRVNVSGFDPVLRAGERLQAIDQDKPVILTALRASEHLAWTRDLRTAASSAVVPQSEHAGGSVISVDPNGQEMKMSLRKYHVDVHIEQGFARTTIDQTYFNHTQSRLEGTFRFPLPADASLSRLAMYVNGRLMEGGMAERRHARDTFEQIVHKMKDPALLEWVDGSTFRMRVFPLEPRQEKRIILSYTQRLPKAYGRTTYRFPAGHSMDIVREWSASVRVRNGASLEWHCPSHGLSQSSENGDLVLTAEESDSRMLSDLVVELNDSQPNETRGTGIGDADWSHAEHENHKYLMLRYRPKLPRQPRRGRRHWTILFESSADRNPILARTQVQIVRTLLTNAEHSDTFQVVTANTEPHVCSADVQTCSMANVETAVKLLEDSHLVGALDLEKSLDVVGRCVEKARAVDDQTEQLVIHLGSAIPVLGEHDQGELLRKLPEGADYIGVGVGKLWSRPFMKAAAGRTGGYFTQINPDEEVAWRAFELSSLLDAPRLLDLSVNSIAESGAVDQRSGWMTVTDTLVHGEELCAVVRLDAGAEYPSEVRVRGRMRGRDWQRSLKPDSTLGSADFLPRTWAKLEIDRLVADSAVEHQNEIIQLSKSMYVMSPFTSLLVLENEQMYSQFNIDRGRDDHWAIYKCPDEIKVVREPLEGSIRTQESIASSNSEFLNSIRFLPHVVWGDHQAGSYFTSNGRDWLRGSSLSVSGIVSNGKQMAPQGITRLNSLFGFADGSRELQQFVDLSSVVDGERILELDRGLSSFRQDSTLSFQVPMMIREAQLGLDLTADESGQIRSLFAGRSLSDRQMLQFRGKEIFRDDLGESFRRYHLPRGQLLGESRFRSARQATGFLSPFDVAAIDVQSLSTGFEDLSIVDFDRRSLEWAERMPQLLVSPDQQGPVPRFSRRKQINLRFEGGYFGDEWGRVAGFDSLRRFSRQYPDGFEPIDGRRGIRLPQFEGDYGGPRSNPVSNLHPVALKEQTSAYWRDLISFAPGLNTSWSDVLAVSELRSRSQDASGSSPGKVAPTARRLIERARSRGSEEITYPAGDGRDEFVLTCDGFGRHSYRRELSNGLVEQVECDGKTLIHAYPELGLAAERKFSRFHRRTIERLVPWLLPPVENMSRHADIVSISDRVVAVIPKTPERPSNDDDRADFSVVATHLVFGVDGKLLEKRFVRNGDGTTLNRLVFEPSGRIRMFDGDGRLVATVELRREFVEVGEMAEIESSLVLLPMPIRSIEFLDQQQAEFDAGKPHRTDADSTKWHLSRVLAFLAENRKVDARDVIRSEFLEKGDQRDGLYVLLSRTAGMKQETSDAGHADELRPSVEGSLLRQFLRQHSGMVEAGKTDEEFDLDHDDESFVWRQAAIHNVYVRWNSGKATESKTRSQIRSELEASLKTLARCRRTSDSLWVLSTIRKQLEAADHKTILADSLSDYEEHPLLFRVAQVEQARLLFSAGRHRRARQVYAVVLQELAEDGMLLPVDQELRDAYVAGNHLGGWRRLVLKCSDLLLDADAPQAACVLAAHLRVCGDVRVCEDVLDDVLTTTSLKDDPDIAMMAVEQFRQLQNGKADDILDSLLVQPSVESDARMWRYAAQVAEELGHHQRALMRMEHAVHLDFVNRPEVVNVETVRRTYLDLMGRFEKVVDASRTLERQVPHDLCARLIRAADQWRTLDDDVTGCCHAVAGILSGLGKKQIAWQYLTTPLAGRSGESMPWRKLAQNLSTEGRVDLADMAWTRAFEFERTNPEILLEHANMLRAHQRNFEADRLLRQIIDNNWQPRFAKVRQQADALLP